MRLERRVAAGAAPGAASRRAGVCDVGAVSAPEPQPDDTGEPGDTGPASPLFSVVVPTYDRPALLPQAVASILGQSVADLECIVVDDASPAAPNLPDDPRLVVVRRTHNGGPAATINTGAARARGRYLAFLADDDLWTPDRLELALEGLARAPIALCWSRFLDEPPAPKPVLDGAVHDVILDAVTPSMCATAIDRTIWEPLDESFLACEDVEWWLRITRERRVATVPRFGCLVRRHDEVRGRHGDTARVAGSVRLLDEHRAWFATHRRAAALRWMRVGLTAARAGDRATARRAYRRSLRARPGLRSAVHLARTYVGNRL